MASSFGVWLITVLAQTLERRVASSLRQMRLTMRCRGCSTSLRALDWYRWMSLNCPYRRGPAEGQG